MRAVADLLNEIDCLNSELNAYRIALKQKPLEVILQALKATKDTPYPEYIRGQENWLGQKGYFLAREELLNYIQENY